MNLPISSWAIRNPIPVVVAFTLLMVAGLYSYSRLPIKQYPNIAFPMVVATIVQEGAAPTELENQVTRIVENSIAGLPDIELLQSSVTLGASTTIIQFKIGTDLQKAKDDEQMLSEKQVENFVTYEELLKQQQRLGAKEDKSERDWKDYVVASLYTLNPPVRADYGDMRIFKIRPGRKARTGNELIWGKKKPYFIFRDYKTSATYGAVEVPVSPGLYEVLTSWFAYVGKVPKYLLGRAIEAHDLLNYVERAFKPTGKRIGIDLLRHAYIHAHLPAISTDIKAKQVLAKQMLHSVDRQAHYFPKNV
jgi:hypothetical protein